MDYPAYVTIEGWSRLSGDKRSKIYEKLGDGRLRAVKDGKSLRIDVAFGLAQIRALPPAQIRPSGKQQAAETSQPKHPAKPARAAT